MHAYDCSPDFALGMLVARSRCSYTWIVGQVFIFGFEILDYMDYSHVAFIHIVPVDLVQQQS